VPAGKLGVGMLEVRFSRDDRLIMYGGQADPGDASHFTIDFSVNGHTAILDGWLMADNGVWIAPRGEEVSWRNGPYLAVPSWTPRESNAHSGF
jgi:hypothetical protein